MLGLRWKTVLLICVIHTAVVFLFVAWTWMSPPAEMPPLVVIGLLDYPSMLPVAWLLDLFNIDTAEMNLLELGLLLAIVGNLQWIVIARLLWPITFGYKPDMGLVDERIRARRKKRGLPDLFEHHDDVHQ